MGDRIVVVPYPGTGFTFRWGPALLPWKRHYGGAQMLSLEPEGGIVHVRVFSLDETQPVAVGHLPILASVLKPTITSQGEQGSVPEDALWAISAWRAAHASGQAGAFAVRLGKAVDLVWETVTDNADGNTVDNCFVESAYPARHSDGKFSLVTVITHRLAKDSHARTDA